MNKRSKSVISRKYMNCSMTERQDTSKYINKFPCLYNNRRNLKPFHYSSLQSIILPSLELNLPYSKEKRIVYRSLFKNCYSHMNDVNFTKKLSMFHNHFQSLCNNNYAFYKLKEIFPNTFRTESTKKTKLKALNLLKKLPKINEVRRTLYNSKCKKSK